MPTIASRLRSDPITNTVNPVPASKISLPPLSPAVPGMNPNLRSPLPNLVTTSSDALRQYYAGGKVPQYRFPPLKPIS